MNSDARPSTPMPASRFSIGLREVTRRRLAGIDCHELQPDDGTARHHVCVAVPASYAAKPRRSYPLVVLLNSSELFGSAVEMSRLMAQTREIDECIVLCLETPIASAGDVQRHGGFISGSLLSWCRERYRVARGPAALFGGLPGIAEALVRDVGAAVLQSLPGPGGRLDQADLVPALVGGLRRQRGTGHQYGSELVPLGNPLLSRALGVLRPLFGWLSSSGAQTPPDGSRHVLLAQQMKRDFEVFAVLPASAAENPARRYPTLLVLDANIELSTAAEAAAQMARRGEIEEIIVIGVGIPRSEGIVEFGFRRFEEFAPPPDGYRFDDRLGRIFRALFATRGKDARKCVGKAAQLHDFMVDELLPTLAQLPIDENRLGILGHSAGGTFVAYALCQERSPFRDYAIISPGVGMSGSWLLREPQASRTLTSTARKAFFCVGGDEKTNLFCQIAGIPDTEALSHQVGKQQPGLKVRYQCFDGETHSSIYPPAVAEALRALYGAAPALEGWT